jgi:membrane protein DedA with SNARE-associated domain
LLAHLTDTLTVLIANLYVSAGLLGIVLAMALESCCIPLPSEVVMPIAGIMVAGATIQGHFYKILTGINPYVALVLVAVAGAIGCLIGSMAAYGIGYSGGRPLMLKYGRYVLISQHDADKADAFFRRWGSATAFFSRLLPVVRTYISLPAGIAKMPFARFCIYTFLGSFPWSLGLAYAGYVLGNHLSELSPIFHDLDVVILVAIVLLVVLYIWRHVRNDRKAREAHAMNGQGHSGQQMPPMNMSAQQARSQFAPMQQNWNQPSPQQQPMMAPSQQWGQSSAPQQFASPSQQQWGQQFAPPQQWQQPGQTQSPQQPTPQPPYAPPYQQGWGQPPQQFPYPQQSPQPASPQQAWPQQYGDDRTIRR